METNIDLVQIINEIDIDNKKHARELLREYIKTHPTDEDGWYLYARIAENLDQRILCLKKVIDLNPEYKDAQYQLERVKSQKSNTTEKRQSQEKANAPNVRLSSKSVITILSIIVVILISLILYTSFIQPKLISSSNPLILLIRNSFDNVQSSIPFLPGSSIKNQIKKKFAAIDDVTIPWEMKMHEETLSGLTYGNYYSITISVDKYKTNQFIKELGMENEFMELAVLAKPLSDAYLEAEIVLGGYEPDENNRIPYEKVLECVNARSLLFDYAYHIYSGDVSYPVPTLEENSCTRYESYYDQFMSGLR